MPESRRTWQDGGRLAVTLFADAGPVAPGALESEARRVGDALGTTLALTIATIA